MSEESHANPNYNFRMFGPHGIDNERDANNSLEPVETNIQYFMSAMYDNENSNEFYDEYKWESIASVINCYKDTAPFILNEEDELELIETALKDPEFTHYLKK